MKPIIAAVLPLFLLACAGPNLVPGQSTAADVRAAMGTPADTRAGEGGETVYYYPHFPWSHVSYAARVGADGRLVAVEQRMTEENIKKVVIEKTTTKEVRDLLGPPWEPMDRPHRDIWTYPMRIKGDPTPKWFIVQASKDGIVRETYLMDDWNFVPRDTPGGMRR